MHKVMVVDDEADVRKLIEKRLGAAGYKVVTFASAIDALPAIAIEDPDIILMDVNMPSMDGLEACRRITSDHPSIPVLFLTAQSDIDNRVQGFEAGGRDYIPKPFAPAELLARLKATLREKLAKEAADRRAETFEILAITDSLTGLSNRRYFEKVYEEELQRARRDHQEISCLMIDIDNFKSVNDTYGHAAGDLVIKEVARAIRATTRAIDLVARYGGEEFIAILHNTDWKGAMLIAERIRAAVELADHGESMPRATVSVGVSSGPTEEMILDADKALYEAKRKGRNRVERWVARR